MHCKEEVKQMAYFNCQACAYHCPGGELWAEGGQIMTEAELLEFERDRALYRVEVLERLVETLWLAAKRRGGIPEMPSHIAATIDEVVEDRMVAKEVVYQTTQRT
jgi:hypothetical protein